MIEANLEVKAKAKPGPKPKNADGVEAKEVILGFSHERFIAAQKPDDFLAKYVIPKYADKQVAWVHKEDVIQSFRGWELLYWDASNDTLGVVKKMDDATKKTGTVLAWRDIRIKEALAKDWQKRQQIANRVTQADNTDAQAKAFNDQIKARTGGKISAKPLDDSD